jgi:hypothetical protein
VNESKRSIRNEEMLSGRSIVINNVGWIKIGACRTGFYPQKGKTLTLLAVILCRPECAAPYLL